MNNINKEKSKKLFFSILKDKRIQKHLKKLKQHHKESFEHVKRVGLLCVKLGYKNNLQKNEIILLGNAGLLHDLGKLGIKKEILSKKTKLNHEEKKIIKQHPRTGFLELNNLGYETIGKIIIAHHEFSKTPYPRKIKDRRKNKRQISSRRKIHSEKNLLVKKLAQILSVADVYDALKNKRAYKNALDKKEIKKIMKKQFIGNKKYIKQVLN